ncbi:2OG-Fe(II) oxygenase [Algoriphagus sediminis]|uniref:2OG-Fe(II) oxygenase family protein n=1 Tax=Algoriphagus sediminis TaxID=3057113 RepID=A0ABT7Y8U7_9BACT|nr:2OG-Fe(II) oxygenase family protein [Algoriphagus sediminis]MDN3202929.1 2OG-Fe(II) oxygenase family protein [Algoriphagus sediminis]
MHLSQSQINEYRHNGWVIIEDFLDSKLAENLYQTLANEVPWEITYLGRLGPVKFPLSQMETLTKRQLNIIEQTIAQGSEKGFQFHYCNYNIQKAIKSKEEVPSSLKRSCELIFNDSFTLFLAQLSGESSINDHNFLASYYPDSGFLMDHNDELKDVNRKLAFVLQLSRNWKSEFGGNLEILDDSGFVKEKLVPKFNSLVVFKVPLNHRVSKVIHKGPEKRLAIHGWGLENSVGSC